MSTWTPITNLIGPTGPTGPDAGFTGPTGPVAQSSWTPYFGTYPELITVGTPAGSFFSEGLTGSYYPVIRSFQRYVTASMYFTIPTLIYDVTNLGLSDNLDLSYPSTNNVSDISAAWVVNYPSVFPVCDHGGLTGSYFNLVAGDSFGIVYDEAQINFIHNGSVFWSVSDPDILGRMLGKTLFLDVSCGGLTNIENLVFSSSGSRGTMIYGAAGLPGVTGNAPANSRVGDLYIDYDSGIMYRYQL